MDSSRQFMWRDEKCPPQLERDASVYTVMFDVTLLRKTPIDRTTWGGVQYARSD